VETGSTNGRGAQADLLNHEMETGMRKLVFLSVLGLGGVSALAQTPVASRFDADAEGWDVIDLAGLGNYTPIGAAAAEWQGDGGNPGGHVRANDPSTGSFFFRAPASYLGLKGEYVGQSLTFELFTTHDTYGSDNAVLLVGDGGQVLAAAISQPPVNAWAGYTISLSADNFRVGNLGGSIVAADAFADVMNDLEGVYLPGEFATGLIETTRLDNVVLTPEPGAIGLLLLGVAALRRG
jgi:hypothetical protein